MDGRDVKLAQVRLTVPPTWEDVPTVDAVVIAMPGVPKNHFRPNLVVTAVPSSDPIEVLSSVTIASAYDTNPGAHVVACDVWPHASVPGRRIEFGYDSGLGYIYVTRWVFATGRHHVHVTASRAADDVLVLDEVFGMVASTIAFPLEA
jgi:hypothetical protein